MGLHMVRGSTEVGFVFRGVGSRVSIAELVAFCFLECTEAIMIVSQNRGTPI